MDNATPPADHSTSTAPTVQVTGTLSPKLNLADFQNAVPALRELAIVNDTDADLKDLQLTLESEPAFLRRKVWHIDHLGRQASIRISDLDVPLDGALLGRLTEAETATVTLRLAHRSDDAEVIALATHTVELLPRNQWGGISCLPEMVAAFVQPNEPAVERILKQAAEVLRKAGKPAALNGYEGGARRAWELASAIWAAVGAMGLDYALPPASFERAGQKVRGPSQVTESGLATCLDLALLLCSALEQAGLHPVLVFTHSHAFPGVWLKAEEFATATIDDATALRKRIKLKELILFESTLLTHRPAPAFSFAISRGEQQIAEDAEQLFELAVDIRRARLQRIKPLASEQAVTAAPVDASAGLQILGVEDAPDLPDAPAEEGRPADETPEDRLKRWQRKLLDLSMRNNLLNFKTGKKGVQLDAPDPGRLEDILAGGQSLRLLPRPALMDGADPRSQSIHESREQELVREQHAKDALQRNEIFVGLTQSEMESRLTELFRSSRAAIQEGGANTLYLALGFLSWTQDDKDGKRVRAPLILVPVQLERRSARSGFTLKLYDDEPRFNPTLLEMLRQDFELDLGIRDSELPKDDAGLDVRGIWNTVYRAIKDIKGWEVAEDVVLSTFSFAKYLMWKDLTEHADQLRENAIVRHLIDTPRDAYASAVPFPDPRRLDADLPPERLFCPLPADSSQLSAIVAGSRGKDFVLIGPPGTGKSQTISNLIVQCLAEGKRVLFVSEKMAALNVVYRRLAKVGLGRFCLELHSNKARKTDVLAQLKRSWDAASVQAPEEWQSEAARLGALRNDLNRYVEHLHYRYPNGLSVYNAIGKAVSGHAMPAVALSWPSADYHTGEAMRALRNAAELLDVHASTFAEAGLAAGPLAPVTETEWSPGWQTALLEAVRQTQPAAEVLEASAQQFCGATGIPLPVLTDKVRQGLLRLATALPTAAGYDWRFTMWPDAKQVTERLRDGCALLTQYTELRNQLSTPVPQATLDTLAEALVSLERSRELLGQLATPWSESIRTRVAEGTALLLQRRELRRQLALEYPDTVPSATVRALDAEWRTAEQSAWPLSALRRRSVERQLKTLCNAGGNPIPATDIQNLLLIDAIDQQLQELDGLTGITEHTWAGIKTDISAIEAAQRFQTALAAARERQDWDDTGFEAVEAGLCGGTARSDLQRLRELRQIAAAFTTWNALGEQTHQAWAGHDTDADLAQTYTFFQAALLAAREDRPWADVGLTQIASGRLGGRLSDDLRIMRDMVAVRQRLDAFDDLAGKTSNLWRGLQTEHADVSRALTFHGEISGALAHIATTPDSLLACKEPIARILGGADILLEPVGAIATAARHYAECLAQYEASVSALEGRYGSAVGRASLRPLHPAAVAAQAQQILAHANRLHAWCAWRKVRENAIALGLAPLVSALEEGVVASGRAAEAFEVNYARWWLNVAVDADMVLRSFVSVEHEKRIRDFRELDAKFTELTQAWLRAQLSAGLPAAERVDRGSDWGTLRYEMQKKTQHLPLRELLARAGGAVMQLTPCLLMSPLSIAQYLLADTGKFNVVIFDEASQIAVWDAVGALARAEQVIMVGDPKQLPPTSFFDRAEAAEVDVDVEVELESILEECIGANIPTMTLSWHYRSRHEGLIAFSNYRYYDGELITFPSPITEDRAVSFHLVPNAKYVKGDARHNQEEAKALVVDLVARLKSPDFRESGRTIGVVTFNAQQQTLIEDLLDEERRKDPSIESYFLENQIEPVFVKNLESVQGDERDIMYFSITFGPGVDSQLSMNFGPLNKQGGERRLNVAITRARHELRVFCSFRPEQMDLTRTQAVGVRDLKHFLEYAERGARALGEAVAGSVGGFESPFEQAVAVALRERGWQVHPQIGVSAFRVDRGIVDPDAPGRYLAGVECDGATYHRSASARDRDKLREQILRDLGWEIVRIWSTDWWIDMPGTLDKVHRQLSTLVETRRASAQEQPAAALAVAPASVRFKEEPSTGLPPVSGLEQQLTPGLSEIATTAEEECERPVTYARNAAGSETVGEGLVWFVETDLQATGHVGDPEQFFESNYDSRLLAMMEYVIAVEGPVRDEVLARRIARAHGWLRTGARIHERVAGLASRHFQRQTEDVGDFYWPKKDTPAQIVSFRRPVPGQARVVDEIPFVELCALAAEVRATVDDRDQGLQAMARAIGLAKLRTASRERLQRAWDGAGH